MSVGDHPDHTVYVCGCGQRPVMPVSVANDRPSRLERVGEALFVAMLLAKDQEGRADTSVNEVAARAIRRARIFDKTWREKVELE